MAVQRTELGRDRAAPKEDFHLSASREGRCECIAMLLHIAAMLLHSAFSCTHVYAFSALVMSADSNSWLALSAACLCHYRTCEGIPQCLTSFGSADGQASRQCSQDAELDIGPGCHRLGPLSGTTILGQGHTQYVWLRCTSCCLPFTFPSD